MRFAPFPLGWLMTRKNHVVIVTPFAPYDGITHAGGMYIGRYIDVVGRTSTVTVIAPRTETNLRSQGELSKRGISVLLVPEKSASPAARVRTILYKAVRGSAFDPSFVRTFLNSARIRQVVQSADVVDLQWLQSAHLIDYVRRVAPGAKVVFTAHDVVTQRWSRAVTAAHAPHRKLFYLARSITARMNERRLFASCDLLVLFSAKDAKLAQTIAPSCLTHVVTPPVHTQEVPSTSARFDEIQEARRASAPPVVLFTGSLSRPENNEAAVALVRDIWPLVRKPDGAQLVIAGAGPSSELQTAVAGHRDITLTGFVPSLAPFYRSASVFVVPLVRGAGIKFKTVEALLWGLPVVTTQVGAEGVQGGAPIFALADDKRTFSDAITSSLADLERTREVGAAAWAWAHRVYSTDLFERDVADVIRLAPIAIRQGGTEC